jgi:farnesyl-diphosphate farnesyltransferase
LRLGRCYVPLQNLKKWRLTPADLLDHSNMDRFRGLYAHHLEVASGHLQAGWQYTNALPYRALRLRLACAWPLLIGAATLQKLRRANVLDPAQRVKISRREVRALITRSLVWYPWPAKWSRLFPAG